MKESGPDRAGEAKYHLLFSNSPVGMYFSTPEGRFLDVNPAFAEMVGYESPADMIATITDIAKQFYARPEDRERMKQTLASEGRIVNFETEIYRRDGTRIWISKNMYAVRDADGTILHYSGSCIDITGRKQTEEGLRTANRALRVRGECSKAVIHSETEGELLKEVCRIISEAAGYSMVWVGYAENDAEKSVRPVAQIGFKEHYLESLRVSWGDSENGRGPSGTAIRTGRSATIRNIPNDPRLAAWRKIEAQKYGYTAAIALPLSHGGLTFGMLGIYSPEPDAFGTAETELLAALTDDLAHGIMALREKEARRKAEEDLAAERELLLTLINNIPDAIFYKDMEGRYIFVNKAKMEQFGIDTAEKIVGKTVYDFFPKEQADIFAAKERQSLESGAILQFWEDRIKTPGGGIVWHFNTKVPIRDKEGRPVGLITICRDITEQKKAEEALKKSLEEKETLFKELQHRVKNNLGLVSSLLSLGMDEVQDKKIHQIFTGAQARIRSISAVYEQLYQSPDLRTAELDVYIKNLAERLIDAYAVDSDRVRFVTRLAKAVIDTRRSVPVGLILNELLTNALKYAYPEGKEGEILVELEKNDNTVTVRVSDKGTGLPEGFDPETSAHLGMKLVRLLAEQIGGTVNFSGSPGEGTSVQVDFPVEY